MLRHFSPDYYKTLEEVNDRLPAELGYKVKVEHRLFDYLGELLTEEEKITLCGEGGDELQRVKVFVAVITPRSASVRPSSA
ncbi:hypothetical protein JCM3770_000711 [Rhodotorula araucariae]